MTVIDLLTPAATVTVASLRMRSAYLPAARTWLKEKLEVLDRRPVHMVFQLPCCSICSETKPVALCATVPVTTTCAPEGTDGFVVAATLKAVFTVRRWTVLLTRAAVLAEAPRTTR